jgi:hypothetical protein
MVNCLGYSIRMITDDFKTTKGGLRVKLRYSLGWADAIVQARYATPPPEEVVEDFRACLPRVKPGWKWEISLNRPHNPHGWGVPLDFVLMASARRS